MNIANKLTLLRVLLIPVFIFLLEVGVVLTDTTLTSLRIATGLIFVIASVTDFLDGYLARKYQLVTNFGVFFDPMADKLLVIVALMYIQAAELIPTWAVFIIIARELMVTGLRVLLVQDGGQVMAAALPGKIKTFSQMFSIIFFLFADFGVGGGHYYLAQSSFYLSLFFTIYSGAEYFYKARFLFKNL